MTRTLGLSADLSAVAVTFALLVALLGLLLLGVELGRRRWEGLLTVGVTGVLATVLALVAVLRPVRVDTRGTKVGPKVVVLVDRSRAMLLPGDEGLREEAAKRAVAALRVSGKDARLVTLGFGEGAPRPLDDLALAPPTALHSDLSAALRDVVGKADEQPRAIVVVSGGRLDAPGPESIPQAMAALLEGGRIPVHTVAVARRVPRDASVRAVHAAGAAVAHQPLALTVEIGCDGLACDAVPVTVRELLDGAPPALLASGLAKLENGTSTLGLSVTLDRAGPRLIEVAIEAPPGDEIPENDRRYLAFDVARERVRVLHIAGRPTYDVRALRMWLKGNASVDVVAFFILRTDRSDTRVADEQSELALIRFPVDELFTEHLRSFDAVILQDFDAATYKLVRHLPNLASYVERGGGLVMVGGPDAFLRGGYEGTPIERVVPVELPTEAKAHPFDLGNTVPRATAAGKAAPVLAPLRALFGDDLPTMPGVNIVGDARPGALVLWEHPTRETRTGKPMPLLALGEYGDGRSIALALDGTHRLGFSEAAAKVAGRGHGALWDGLLGWLMRDPRFEPAQVELPGPCVAGEPLTLAITPLPGTTGEVELEVTPLSPGATPMRARAPVRPEGGTVTLALPALAPGGYMAKVRAGTSSTRRAFACEKGGDAWADPRPDEDRLRAIARATGGTFTRANDAGSIALPAPTEVNAERTVTPIAPSYLWTLLAALALGGHWIARRRGGLALGPVRD